MVGKGDGIAQTVILPGLSLFLNPDSQYTGWRFARFIKPGMINVSAMASLPACLVSGLINGTLWFHVLSINRITARREMSSFCLRHMMTMAAHFGEILSSDVGVSIPALMVASSILLMVSCVVYK